MDKRTEELVEEAVKKIAANIRKRAEEFRETDRKKELDINVIESIWHETRADSDRVIAELMSALTGTVCEKELIVKKNRK
jgi:DNA polymerase II large subunit